MKKIIFISIIIASPAFTSLFEPAQPFTAPFINGINTEVDSTSVYIDEDKVSWESADDKSARAWIVTSKSLKNNFLNSFVA